MIQELAFLITEDYFTNWENVRQLLLLPASLMRVALPALSSLRSSDQSEVRSYGERRGRFGVEGLGNSSNLYR